ncbi:MAG: hypothetical protein ACRDNJ_04235 [Solirubrobacteraceae bacterium]
MSTRSRLIARIVAGVLIGVALLGGALAVVAIEGEALNGPMMAVVVLGALGGWALDATWLTFAIVQLTTLGDGQDGEEGGDERREPEPPPPGPVLPSGEPGWWPEFERDLRAHADARERTPVG